MGFDANRKHRRSIRLKGYDYTQPGAYFITICTHNRECLFGEIVDGEMVLNDAGRVAEACWQAIPDHFPHVELDTHVIMPNHVHGIVVIRDDGVGSNDDEAGADVGANDDGGGANVVGANDDGGGANVVGANVVGANGDGGGANVVGAKNFSPLRQQPQQPKWPRGTSRTVGSIVRGFKIGVTKWFRAHTHRGTVWQRNYYEHIIRNQESLNRIRQYILDNPARWAFDHENPNASAGAAPRNHLGGKKI